jgi:hypothetical protein
MKKLIIIVLLTLLINANFTTNANAFVGEIRIILRSIAKFLKGGADNTIKGGSKTLDDLLKGAGKDSNRSIDDALKKMGQRPEEALLPKTDKFTNLNTLTKDESLILERVGSEKHSNNYLAVNSNKIKPLKGRRWLKELAEEGTQEGIQEIGEEGFQEAAEKGLSNLSAENDFYKYVKLNWIGRVYLRSDYYNQPKVEEKMLLVCKTKYEVFYFSILMEEKIKTASLIDHKSLLNVSYPTLLPQELAVLEDKDEFKVMSVLPEAGRYPKHYFTIFSNQSFNYDKRLSGTESPGVIINKAFRGSDQNNNCYKGTKKGLFRIKQ